MDSSMDLEITRATVEALDRELRSAQAAFASSVDRALAMDVLLCEARAEIAHLRARNEVLERVAETSRKLSFTAQTSGGVAGRDEGLVAAIDDHAKALVALSPPAALSGEWAEVECDCNVPLLEGAGQHHPACSVFRLPAKPSNDGGQP